MASKKEITYLHFKKYVNDKDRSVNFIIENYLTKTQSMFSYSGLPDSLPADILESMLQKGGNCFITKVNDELVALEGNTSGFRDVYGREKDFIVNNPYINLNKTYAIGKDGILFKNDSNQTGLLPIIGMYATLITDSKISLNTADLLTRLMLIISASDDTTKQSAESFIEKIKDGELSVIGENSFFDGIKTHAGTGASNQQITQLIELNQFYKANLMNELGLNANFNMKRERLNESEIGLNIDGLLPFTHNMLHERAVALEAINKMFDLEITVDFHSAWKLEHETADKMIEHTDTVNDEEPYGNEPETLVEPETVVEPEIIVEETETVEEPETVEEVEEVKPVEDVEAVEDEEEPK